MLFASVFCFLCVGFAANVGAQEDVEEERQERIEALLERIESLSEILSQIQEHGDVEVIREELLQEDTGKLTECYPYLTSYITYGVNNDAEEVKKLQMFLNEHMAVSLDVDGHYGEDDKEVVKSFQVMYTDEVLLPWGTTRPTGQVYMTTKAKINDIMCPTVDVPVPVVGKKAEEDVSAEDATEENELEEGVDAVDLWKEEGAFEDDDNTTSPLAAASLLNVDGEVNYLPILVIIIGLIGFAGALYYAYAPKKQRKGKVIS